MKVKEDVTVKIIFKPIVKISFWNIIKLRILSNSIPEIKKFIKQLKRISI